MSLDDPQFTKLIIYNSMADLIANQDVIIIWSVVRASLRPDIHIES